MLQGWLEIQAAKRAAHILPEAEFFYRPLPPRPLKVADIVSFVSHVFDRGDYFLIFVAALAVTLIGLLPAWANNIAFGTVDSHIKKTDSANGRF